MNIPPEAKRVFTGVIFDVYQWRQKMFDGSVATFEALQRPNTVAIIPTANNQIFISFEEQPTKSRAFTLFGGRQEEGEEPLTTAKRELLEETGLESTDWELWKVYQSEGKIQWDTYVFFARNCQKVAEPQLDSGENIAMRTVIFTEFIKIVSRKDFWGQDVTTDILRMQLNPQTLAKFKHRLFKTF